MYKNSLKTTCSPWHNFPTAISPSNPHEFNTTVIHETQIHSKFGIIQTKILIFPTDTEIEINSDEKKINSYSQTSNIKLSEY